MINMIYLLLKARLLSTVPLKGTCNLAPLVLFLRDASRFSRDESSFSRDASRFSRDESRFS